MRSTIQRKTQIPNLRSQWSTDKPLNFRERNVFVMGTSLSFC